MWLDVFGHCHSEGMRGGNSELGAVSANPDTETNHFIIVFPNVPYLKNDFFGTLFGASGRFKHPANTVPFAKSVYLLAHFVLVR